MVAFRRGDFFCSVLVGFAVLRFEFGDETVMMSVDKGILKFVVAISGRP